RHNTVRIEQGSSTKREAQQAKDRSMEDAIFSPRKRRPGRKQGLAARPAAWAEQESVQGLAAAAASPQPFTCLGRGEISRSASLNIKVFIQVLLCVQKGPTSLSLSEEVLIQVLNPSP